jgi:hypothetical protein
MAFRAVTRSTADGRRRVVQPMSTPLPNQPGAGTDRVAEWRPGRAGAVLLNVLAVPLLLIGLAGYLQMAALHLPASGHVTIGPFELLALVLLTGC